MELKKLRCFLKKKKAFCGISNLVAMISPFVMTENLWAWFLSKLHLCIFQSRGCNSRQLDFEFIEETENPRVQVPVYFSFAPSPPLNSVKIVSKCSDRSVVLRFCLAYGMLELERSFPPPVSLCDCVWDDSFLKNIEWSLEGTSEAFLPSRPYRETLYPWWRT